MKKLLFTIIIAILFSCSPNKTTWVAIGDSITYLNEHTDETGNRVTKGYMTLVAEQLPEITYINQGHNGWTSGNIADSIETLGLVRADVYSVFLGTNDWWQGRLVGTLADYQNNTGNNTVFGSFRIIINKLKTLNPKAQIILITPLERVDFVQVGNLKNNAWGSYRDKNGQMLSEFAAAIRLIGETEHFDVVDLYTEPRLSIEKLVKFKYLKDTLTGEYKNYRYPDFIPIPFNPETDEYPYPMESIDMTYDGLHPSDAGYKVIAEKLVEILKK
jgi:lysophospholipase L1-like esterase